MQNSFPFSKVRCTIMLGNPEMNLPGTFHYHDKGMQTTGVVLTGARPPKSEAWLPTWREGSGLRRVPPLLLTILTPRTFLPPWGALRATPWKDPSLPGAPVSSVPVQLDLKVSCVKVKVLRIEGGEGSYNKLLPAFHTLSWTKSRSIMLWERSWAEKCTSFSSCWVLVLKCSLRQRAI